MVSGCCPSHISRELNQANSKSHGRVTLYSRLLFAWKSSKKLLQGKGEKKNYRPSLFLLCVLCIQGFSFHVSITEPTITVSFLRVANVNDSAIYAQKCGARSFIVVVLANAGSWLSIDLLFHSSLFCCCCFDSPRKIFCSIVLSGMAFPLSLSLHWNVAFLFWRIDFFMSMKPETSKMRERERWRE